MLGKAGVTGWPAGWLGGRRGVEDDEDFFVCAALQLDLTAIGRPGCPSGAAVANLGSLGRVLGPPSHSLTCHSWSPAGAVLGWIDDPGRACYCIHGMYADCGPSWPDCGHPKHGPAPKHAEGRMPTGHSGLRVSCLRVIGKRIRPVNGGKKNDDGTAQQCNGTGEIPGVWSKPDLVAWAQKLGIDKIATHI